MGKVILYYKTSPHSLVQVEFLITLLVLEALVSCILAYTVLTEVHP